MVFADLRRFIFWASALAETSNLARHSFLWRWWRAWMSSCSFVPGRGVEPPLSLQSMLAAVNGRAGSASSIREIPKKVSSLVAMMVAVVVVIVAGCTIDCVNTVIDKIEMFLFQFF